MNIRDLLDVRSICEYGSLRQAAAAIGITQPTLGARIAQLEAQLGATLFDRSRGQSQPTDLALFIAGRATALSEDAARLAREARRLASGKAGLVRIGLGPAPTRMLLAGIIATITESWPEVSLEIVSGSTAQLADGLVRSELDLLVCPPLDDRRGAIESEPLLETGIVVVARPQHPMCREPPDGIAGLFKYPIAITFLEQRYLDILRSDYGIDLDAQVGRVVCSDFEMLVRVVMNSSRLFTAGPRFAFANELDAGRLCIVGTDVPFKHVIDLHRNRDAYPLPAVTRVQEVIQQAFVDIRATHSGEVTSPRR
jgi:DNA-binding transcriptional LysR family regulator